MSFPQEPGWREGRHSDTSKAAAKQVTPRAPTMLQLIADLLAEGPASPEQLHAKLRSRGERSLLTSVRARVCQLHKSGRVIDSGARGIGESGTAKVVIWRLASAEELSMFLARKAVEGEKGEHPHG